jgi:uncharacterized protein
MDNNKPTRKQEITLILKPLVDCNLNCKYCYISADPHNGMRMDRGTLRNVIGRFLSYGGPERGVHFIWHGGEPLLMGREFFQDVVEIQSEFGANYRIRNGIQTNATLLTEDFLSFFAEHNFTIGSSLDGPQQLHDSQRCYHNGFGTFDDVISVIESYKQGGNGKRQDSIGVVAVMTQKTLECLDEFYDFFVRSGIHVKINPILYEGKGEETREQLGLRPGEYGSALAHLFDRWFYDGASRIDIDPLSEVLGNLLTGESRSCIFGEACYKNFLLVAPNGNVYPCVSWKPLNLLLGNINSQQPEEMFASPVMKSLQVARARALRSCGNCEYLSVCNAGCIRNAYMSSKNFHGRDYYCADYKILYTHASKLLSKELGTDQVMPVKDWQNIASNPNPALQRIVKTRMPSKPK